MLQWESRELWDEIQSGVQIPPLPLTGCLTCVTLLK